MSSAQAFAAQLTAQLDAERTRCVRQIVTRQRVPISDPCGAPAGRVSFTCEAGHTWTVDYCGRCTDEAVTDSTCGVCDDDLAPGSRLTAQTEVA